MKHHRAIPVLLRGAAEFAVSWLIVCAIAYAEERIWLDARTTINGKPAKLAFDTGASHLLLFPTGAERLGLAFTNAAKDLQLAPGLVPMGRTESCEFTMGATRLKTSFGVVEFLLPTLADGVIGWRPVSDNLFAINASRLTATWLADLPEAVTKWAQFKLQTNSDVLILVIPSRGGDSSMILVDTGSEGGVDLSPDLWRDWKAAHTNQAMTLNAYYTPYAGLVVAEEAWAEKVNIGTLEIEDVPVRPASKADLANGPSYRATLGLAALRRLNLVIDGKNGIAYTLATGTAPTDYEHNRIGAVFVPVDMQSENLIGHVMDGSPAWVAGIRNGDILTKIDDLDVTKWRTDPTILPLSRFWSRSPGSKLLLTLERTNKLFKTEVVLRQILSPKNPRTVSTQQH